MPYVEVERGLMKGDNLSELMVGIEEIVGEKLDWKEENNEIVIARRELTLICETLEKLFYELRDLRRQNWEG